MLILASQLLVVEVHRVYYKIALRNAAALRYPILLLLKGNIKLSSSLRNLPFCLQCGVASLHSFAELVCSLSSLSWLTVWWSGAPVVTGQRGAAEGAWGRDFDSIWL